MGVVVSEISIDTMMAVDSVIANSRKRRPTMPAMRRIGIKTAISEACRDGQRHQREVVDAEAKQVHDGEGANEGGRNGDGGNECSSPVAQEDENDKNYQDDREDERTLHVAH